jgi:hypothetical protein
MKFQISFLIILVTTEFGAAADNFTFPDDFLLGAATASYQIEGGWDADGKTELNHLVPALAAFKARFIIPKLYIPPTQCI